ncbi:MAG: hypothetical protein LH468_13645, partial [Nocardioides sp.]|nr:hypothetical protein [Nocardioides sp.]
MAAPALIALAHGSRDKRSSATITGLVEEVRSQRPDLRIEAAFLDVSRPAFQTVVGRGGQGGAAALGGGPRRGAAGAPAARRRG